MKIPLLKGSDGKESVSFTMLIISFIVVTFWLVISIVEGIAGIAIRPFDAATAMAYFTPIAMLYFSRKTWRSSNGSLPSGEQIQNEQEEATRPSVPPESSNSENP